MAAPCELVQLALPVTTIGRRPIATLTLNGVEVKMLVDSGAFHSFLSNATAQALGLKLYRSDVEAWGYTGRVDTMATRVENTGLLGGKLPNLEYLVGGNELGEGIQGILGRNILAAGDTEYDLAHGEVRLSFPKGDCAKTNFAHWAGEAPVVVMPLRPEGDGRYRAPLVDVEINGVTTRTLMDTGAPHSALTLRAAQRAGISGAQLQEHGYVGGGGAGLAKSYLATVDLIELEGQKLRNNRLSVDAVGKRPQGLILGLDYFLSHRIYVSQLQRQVYITWNGTPIFDAQGADASSLDPRYAAAPPAVAADDADALARRGAAALAAGDARKALADLNRACELAPKVASHFHLRAQVLQRLKQNTRALADLDTALDLEPALHEARVQRADLRLAERELAGTHADLQALDAALPPQAHQRLAMARLYARLDQAPPAAQQYALWLDTHPDDSKRGDALRERCALRLRLDLELPLALADCQAAVKASGADARARSTLGWVLLRLGEADQAESAFDAALRLWSLPLTQYGRGLALLQQKNSIAGQRDLDAARRSDARVDEQLQRLGLRWDSQALRLRAAGG